MTEQKCPELWWIPSGGFVMKSGYLAGYDFLGGGYLRELPVDAVRLVPAPIEQPGRLS